MSTFKRFRNKYRLQLRDRDHEPMHVHLVGGEINAKFDLATLELVAGTLLAGLKAEVTDWLRSHQADLIKEWNKWQL